MKTKMLSKKIGYWAGVIVIGTVLGLALQFAKAWTEPTVAPPNQNVGAPINTGNNLQTKQGSLLVGGLGTFYDSYFAAFGGNVGIGTTTPLYKLDVNGDVKGTRLCIGSDCKDAWPGGGISQWITDGNNIYNGNSGNIGIGTNNPQAKLQVNTATIGGGEVRINASGNESGIGYYSSGDDWVAGVGGWGNANKFLIGSINASAGPKITIQTNGNVGIGTTSPGEKLDVNGNVKINGNISLFKFNTDYNPYNPNCSQGQRGTIKMFDYGSGSTKRDVFCVCLYSNLSYKNWYRWFCIDPAND